ncbi:Membrane protein [Colletotrichum higginsianum IMI 349063]|uniref:Membrane protein n=2 Tax=Colletotrichum higginsianum TaxID=80884 RepID=A0A1B7XSQ6_COLHI|nr:Membrane protein [Colletotrichum higginsianum IMI 349063]OBR02803.1 Membrane protein [Colletotrichum higginsianum IMI 349063]TID06599.1 hypothetical protein CH35J_000503 [Colletotrichum higginsianum]GJD00766.1 membrane protein [Colletotrichum higginsianum]
MRQTPLSASKLGMDRRWWLLAVPALWIVAHNVQYIFGVPYMGDPEVMWATRRRLFGKLHILGGGFAMFCGPLQFLGGLRRHYPAAHRWIGRVYNLGIAVGGANAFKMALAASCHPLGQIGFAVLAGIWLATCALGLLAVLQGDVEAHKHWMMRNYAATYAAVTLRVQMPLLMASGMLPYHAAAVAGWTSWIPNLVAAEWWITRSPAEKRLKTK